MNEAETRAELIDPKLKACGWGVTANSSDIDHPVQSMDKPAFKGLSCSVICFLE